MAAESAADLVLTERGMGLGEGQITTCKAEKKSCPSIHNLYHAVFFYCYDATRCLILMLVVEIIQMWDAMCGCLRWWRVCVMGIMICRVMACGCVGCVWGCVRVLACCEMSVVVE